MPAYGRRRARRASGTLTAFAMVAALAACATVPDQDRARTTEASAPHERRCQDVPRTGVSDARSGEFESGSPLLVVSWNIHKNARPGWDRDLARFLAAGGLVLLQESLLEPAMRVTLDAARARWVQAEAWSAPLGPTGALVAAPIAPIDYCVLREPEPAGVPPKSSVVAWFRIAGRSDTLAVASVHSVNFSLALAGYRRQLEALARTLAAHRGPIVVGGDFNTWSPVRAASLDEILGRIGLAAVVPDRDGRSRFLGLPADHLYIRGMTPIESGVARVDSSDHAPIVAALVFTAP